MATRKTLAQLIRDREVDEVQAGLRKQFLANPPAAWTAAQQVFGPLQIERVRTGSKTVARKDK